MQQDGLCRFGPNRKKIAHRVAYRYFLIFFNQRNKLCCQTVQFDVG
jgi:hypothetical protein